MKFDNKGIIKIMPIIVISMFIIFVSLFVSIFFWETFKSYVISPVADIATNSLSGEITANTVNNVNDIESFALGFDFGFDLLFLLAVLVTFSSTMYYAYKLPSLTKITFIFTLFGGSLFAMFTVFYATDVLEWFVNNYLLSMFDLNLTFMTYFITNIGMIFFIWFLFLMLVNQVKNFVQEEYFRE